MSEGWHRCYAESMPDPTDMPPARPAATVVVVREGASGAEVLLLRRSEFGAFPGMWVFPGGRVDVADEGDDEIDKARTAAVREAAEEVGLTLDPDSLVRWAHWTPPAIEPKRFNTWFFVAPMTDDSDDAAVQIDGHEIVEHRWLSPADAIAAGLPMAPPTYVTLRQLAEHPTLAATLTLGPPRGIERFTTRADKTDAGLVLMWHGDAGYDSGDSTADGPRHRMLLGGGTIDYQRD